MSVLTISGNRHEIGTQIGVAFQSHIRRGCRDALDNLPPLSRSDIHKHLVVALHQTRRVFPWVMEEMQGVAQGAGVPLPTLMLFLYEDLWDSEDFETGCTDVAVVRPATIDGRLLIGHNNDEGVDALPPVLLRLAPDDGPVVTGVALGGLGFSVGCNSHGLVVSGNQLSAKDVKPGIPRILLVRAALEARTIDEALQVLLHPLRASSYNNVLGDQLGGVVSVEGSGTTARAVHPQSNGVLTHTNHYLHPDMSHLDGKGDMRSTTLREQRSCQILGEASGRVSVETMKRVLRDHKGYPDSICRHSHDTVTGFSVIYEPEKRLFWYGEGFPCRATYSPVHY